MDFPLSGWRYGPAPFPHLLSPSSPSLIRFRATRCIYVYCETGTLNWVHGYTFNVSPVEHQFLLRVPAKVVGLSHDGHVELEHNQGGVRVVNHRCPMDCISFGIPSLESPPPSPSIPTMMSLQKFLWNPLLMEATFAVAPRHDCHHIPHPEASLCNSEFGD